MARLIYSAITSLDGYVVDEDGGFDWAAPDEEVHRFVNDLERPIGTYLYGRRMFEVMAAWESPDLVSAGSAASRDFAELWQAADKVVYSTTLGAVNVKRSRLEGRFDVSEVRRLKESAAADLSIGGPELASEAIRAGLVDDYHVLLNPVVVGGGRRWLPDGVRVPLELVDSHRFDSGVVGLHYRPR